MAMFGMTAKWARSPDSSSMKLLLSRTWVGALVLLLLSLFVPVGSAAVVVSANREIAAGDAALDGQDVVVDGATLTISGEHTVRSIQLIHGAVLNHPGASAGEPERAVRLTVTGNVSIDAASRIDASGGGYAGAGSPGAGSRGSWAGAGGGHGGVGSASAGSPAGTGGGSFDSVVAPGSWGGPGGNGSNDAFAPGGGLIVLEVTGDVSIAGSVVANGAAGTVDNQGGGAGGTVSIRCAVLRGAGSISADGASGEWFDGGGGAGGRVALFFAANEFTGSLSAVGGGGAGRGGAGTVYLKPASGLGEVRIQNASRGAETPIQSTVVFDLVLRSDAVVLAAAPLSVGTLVVGSGAVLAQAPGSTGLELRVAKDLRVEANGTVSADGKGYPFSGDRGAGTGIPGGWAGAGGSHGGFGGNSASGALGGVSYGSILEPVTFGSQGGDGNGGAGVAGGGAMHFIVGGALVVEGRISADGLASGIDNSGGGAGGSIWISAATCTGGGVISVNGGAGEWYDGGGGGGGRIACYLNANDYKGSLTAVGGGGSQRGGAGTVYLRQTGEREGFLRVDNGGAWGQMTPVRSPEAFRLLITNNASCYAESTLSLARLDLARNSLLTHQTGQTNLELRVAGDVVVAEGAQLIADGKGYPILVDRGPGMGGQKDWAGSGGGHGGMGGHGATGIDGGGHYGSLLAPISLGSQGGTGSDGDGSPGGGVIRMVVVGSLVVDGQLSANGLNATINNSGGGSGGSLWLTVGKLAGKGSISVNGGAGEWFDGGGGGGGRIALYYDTMEYTGGLTTYGGGGSQRGGAGTIYQRKSGTSFGQLQVHNGDVRGNYTPLSSPEAFQLVIEGQAYAYPVEALTLRDLEVRANATLVQLVGQTNLNLHVLHNALIAAGGTVTGDGRGYPVGADRGPGTGQIGDWAGSGGGHGGLGGSTASGAVPGRNYGSILEPVMRGSQGGAGSGGDGVAGGGAIRLVVDGVLTVDGRLSVDGVNSPVDNSGGGSGGSLWVTAGSIAGAGTVSANGGNGEWVDGGGGGGGRIAFYFGTNDYKGSLTTYGGGGSQRGGAGTIYQRKSGTAYGQLLIHNGGVWGNYTPLTSPEAFQVTLAEMAYVYPETALTLHDLEIRTNTVLTHLVGQPKCEVHVLNNLTVLPEGVINADGRGYPVGEDRGPGVGTLKDTTGSGGGHGGRGGASASGMPGGLPYGSYIEPATLGSQGGPGSGGVGGAGGGVLRLIVDNEFQLGGRVSATGLNGVPDNSGGGAGGSIFVTAKVLSGSGLLSVDGGNGEWFDGGGGAGGRIALHLQRNSFGGSVFSRGGGGSARGGSGTIYTRLGAEAGGQLVIDNGGNPGALTPIDVPPATRLVLSAGTTVYPVRRLDVVSLQLKSGATLTHTNGQSGLSIQVAGDFSLEQGASLTASGKGYPVGSEPGPGAATSAGGLGAGGAYGGNGGLAAGGAAVGGLAYGTPIEPAEYGSSGAPGGDPTNPRSPGGGAIRVVVGGTFSLEGSVASDGTTAWYDNQGGGAGGSIWITAARLAGAGTITANGGGGEWFDGGSGSGGRVALHLGTNDFGGLTTARGGGGGSQVGAAGTIYTRLAGQTVGRLLVENGDRWGAYTLLTSPEPFHLSLANRAQAYSDDTLVLGSLNLAPDSVLTHLTGQEALRAVVLGDAFIGGVIDVNGRGYPIGAETGPGAGGKKDCCGSGAGHGGLGGASANGLPGGVDYDSASEPTALGSQGGAGSGGAGGAGGGAVRLIVGQTLTVDGSITANGLNGAPDNSGGGSGGSVFLSALAFEGKGSLSANGGNGEWFDGGGGSGGRIAVYRTADLFSGALSVAGGGGSARAEDGTVYKGSVAGVVWLSPPAGWIAGETSLEIALFTGGSGTSTVQFMLWHDGQSSLIAQVPGANLDASAPWDTRVLADGAYELEASVFNAQGVRVSDTRRSVTIQNSVAWHGGVVSTNEVWGPGPVHVVRRDITVPNGVTLTIGPGAVVKFMPGVRLILHSGATLDAPGSAAAPVVLTSFLDDSYGGDSNLDADATRPQPGAWRLVVNAGAKVTSSANTRMRFQSQTYGGALAANETWSADSLREISETVSVPSGVTLRLEGGAIVKFAPGQGLTVDAGGKLIVAGSAAQPAVLTSRRDDAFGGDTNEDGTRTTAAAGDWRSIRIADGGSATIDHALIRFGGNSVGNPWGAGGVVEALGGTLEVRNSIIADALKDGAFCYGTTRFENCVVLRCDRGLTAVGTMDVIHCTVEACRIGLLEHVGQLNVRNSIISGSIDAGIEHDLGGGVPVVTYCNVWNPDARRGNYSGVANRDARDGNISAAPRFKDPDSDNFHLNFASAGIDAADGSISLATDLSGAPRYDDPRTGNTGTPAVNGAVPDMGAYEFAETAPSNLDLAVASVDGPGDVVAGQMAHLEWTILNRGAEAFSGPWHDAIYLQNVLTGQRLLVGEPLVGRSITLGPGQTFTGTAEVRVPGGVVSDYRWVVEANSRGDVFEGANASNNEGLSSANSHLTVPVIPLDGAALSGIFAAQEEQQWFQVSAMAGKDVRLALDLEPVSGVTEIYVGRGFMPSPENFTARYREFGAPDTTAIGPGSGDAGGSGAGNTFYVLVVGRVLPAVPAGFKINAVTAPFSIESVANGPVGNAGEVTLDLRGIGFAPDTVFTLKSGGVSRTAVRQSVREAGRAFVTFDLAGVPAGPADLSASSGGVAVTKTAAVTLTNGGTGEFYASLGGPGTTRAGRFTTWFVTYGNRGAIDVKVPLLRFRAPGATEFQVFDNTLNWADSLTFLAINPDVLLPTLGPGQEATVQVRLKSLNPLTVFLDVLGGEEVASNGSDFAWSSLATPAGANPTKWSDMLGTLPRRLGATVGQYHAQLLAELDDLRTDTMRYSYLANVNGRWLFGSEPDDIGRPIPIIEIDPEPSDASPELAAAPKPVKIPGDGIRKTWWVVITIEDYENRSGNSSNNLSGTRVDARDMYDYMTKDLRVPKEQIEAGHDRPGDNSSWTRQFMLESIQAFKGKVDADDNLVVVYSGHGGRGKSGTGYLVPNDRNALSPHAFTDAIDAVGAGTTYFVNDSCHAQAFDDQVDPKNTTFVGLGATSADRTSRDTAHGGELISNLKSQLRKCNSLGKSFEWTASHVAKKYEKDDDLSSRQNPMLTNPKDASLEGKPWNDPSGFEQILKQGLNNLRFHPWTQAFLNLVGSVDPNEKYALAGAGPRHWVQPDQILPFQVLFENKTNAAAPAQEVLVTDDLDSRFDWSTFQLTSISFNDAKLAIPEGLQRFTATTQVGTDPYPVDIDISLNPASGRITCLIQSRDPATGTLPEDPFAGFLPPNNATHRGEGSFTYTVRPHVGLVDGTVLTNRATIIFDPTYGANPPILTPTATNTIDGLAPSSVIQPLPAQGVGEVPIQWSGQDAPNGSGIGSFDIYVSRDNGPFMPWLLATPDKGATFTGDPGSAYRFYSIARDLAGNTEDAPVQPDATIAIGGGAVGPVAIAVEGPRLHVTFTGRLQSAEAITGPWSDVAGATSPYVSAAAGQARFFRARR